MSEHILPIRLYVTIWAALLCLTVITAAVAFVDLGALNTVLALVIASVKALLVVLFFMHVKYSSKLTKLTVVAGIFTFLTLISMTLADYISRAWGLW
jgi:cytochrome c oxidase subunit 4